MRFSGPRHSTVAAYLALFIALGGTSYAAVTITGKNVKNGSLTGADVRNNSLTGTDIKDGSLLAKDFRVGQLHAGATGRRGMQGARGQKGDTGVVGAGSTQVGNMNGIGCNNPIVVGSTTLTVHASSQIWSYGHGAIAVRQSDITEAGLFLRLRNAADTTTLAVSVAQWQGHLQPQDVAPLNTGGLMLTGNNPDTRAAPFSAAPGTYVLQLMAWPNSGTCAFKPDFGWNQGGAMGYMLLRQG